MLKKNMQQLIAEDADINPELDAQIKQGLCCCFPNYQNVFSQTRTWNGSTPAWSVIMIQQQQIAAYLSVVDRLIRVNDEQVRIAGIGNLFVMPAHRKTHLSTQLLDIVAKESHKRGYDYGLLFCEPEIQNVYARCGWRMLVGQTIIRVNESGCDTPLPKNDIGMYYPLTRTDFPEGLIHLQGNNW